MARKEQLEMARMLQVEGYSTRQSVIHYITPKPHRDAKIYSNQKFNIIKKEIYG